MPTDAVGRLAEVSETLSLETAAAALEDVRRLESWLTWTKHRLVVSTMRAAREDQHRWVDEYRAFDDDDADPASVAGRRGLSRADQIAIGERTGISEIAGALQLCEGAAFHLLRRAEILAGQLPATDAALRGGHVTASAAALIVDETQEYVCDVEASISEQQAEPFSRALALTEAGLLSPAMRGNTTGQLSVRARRLREQCHPTSFAQRHQEARAERYVRISPDRDGMARLSALLPAAVAWRIDGRLSAMARRLQESDAARSAVPDGGTGTGTAGAGGFTEQGDTPAGRGGGGLGDGTGAGFVRPVPPPRTIGQLRADVLADLLSKWSLMDAGTDADGAADEAADGAGGDGASTEDAVADGASTDADIVTEGAGGAGSTTTGGVGSTRTGGAGSGRTGTGTGVARGSTRTGRVRWAGGAGSSRTGYIADEPAAPRILLTVPAATLLRSRDAETDEDGRDEAADGPAILGAFGPIAASDARDLAARAASFMIAVIADQIDAPGPAPGDAARVVPVVLTNGRQYRIPDRLRNALQIRDGTCRFPGCRRSAATCDIDHVVPWADGGETTPQNLGHACRKHHVLKHHSGWSVEAESPDTGAGVGTDGSDRLIWTSPAGRRYVSEPEPPPF
ncbi:HNH endonuclease signature motif containing protein [Tersicoccus phoenicis]|uniref:HNH endonuclease signature motif containing protein n=1 Tax=Tersicoccus phoenicis TaxID=554083 RepID=UPI0013562B0E|nr:HNH endonuclease signature motif containing protein [Tersicoccus phoenicis]